MSFGGNINLNIPLKKNPKYSPYQKIIKKFLNIYARYCVYLLNYAKLVK
jgi:hypothetical protein